jgi:hypothetical protein
MSAGISEGLSSRSAKAIIIVARCENASICRGFGESKYLFLTSFN